MHHFEPNQLEKTIIATLAYGEVKKWPMTFWEIFRYLINPGRIDKKPKNHIIHKKIDFESMHKSLDVLQKQGIVGEEDGFYFLKKANFGATILKTRIKQDKIADEKIKKIVHIAKYLQVFPWTKGFFLSGSLVFGWARPESDIDLLIVVKAGHIWTVRFFLSGLLFLLRLKRSNQNIQDRLCLNHFIGDQSLKIPLYSLYNAATYARLVPLYIDEGVLMNFFKRNSWVKQYLAWGYGKYFDDLRRQKKSFLQKLCNDIIETLFWFIGLGSSLENILSALQIRHIKKDPLIYKKGGRIVASKMQIEFHPKSPEKKMLEGYNNNLESLNLFDFEREKDSGLI